MSQNHGVAVRVENCAKTFPDGTRALEPVSLEIAHGETVVLLGPSGCGKTTMLRIIAGLEQPDEGGRVKFNDADVTPIPIEQRNVGMVFQSYALFPNMNVADNIGYGLKIRGVGAAERKARVAELVTLTGIEGLESRRIDQLSGGQRQRVALARAVAVRPSVLLLDEPLTALDAALRERLRGELNRLLRMLGITAIYVTHDQAEAMALGDRVVVMRKGAIAQVGTPRDIYFAPAGRFVAEFIGAANIVAAECNAGTLTLPGGTLKIADGAAAGPVTVMIRPEAIAIVAPENAALRGLVDNVSFIGDRQRLTIGAATDKPIMVDAPNSLRCQAGRTRRPGGRPGRHPPAAGRCAVTARPTLIAQISDLHIKRPGVLAYNRVDTAAALTRCINELNRFLPRPDLVVISGDLADTPAPEEYEHLHALLAPLDIPFAAIPGNHDDRALLRAVLPDQPYAQSQGALNLSRGVGEIDILLIDSSVPGTNYGVLDPATLAWLEAALAASTSRPALLFLHHPPFATGIGHMDVQNLRNADALATLLRRHPRVLTIAAGHVHRAVLTRFAGVPATICPAPNHAVALDLEARLPPSLKIEPPAFHLHAWFPGAGFGRVVTHWVPIGEFDGPHPFFGGDGKLL